MLIDSHLAKLVQTPHWYRLQLPGAIVNEESDLC